MKRGQVAAYDSRNNCQLLCASTRKSICTAWSARTGSGETLPLSNVLTAFRELGSSTSRYWSVPSSTLATDKLPARPLRPRVIVQDAKRNPHHQARVAVDETSQHRRISCGDKNNQLSVTLKSASRSFDVACAISNATPWIPPVRPQFGVERLRIAPDGWKGNARSDGGTPMLGAQAASVEDPQSPCHHVFLYASVREFVYTSLGCRIGRASP
jgi:hypothetical protein